MMASTNTVMVVMVMKMNEHFDAVERGRRVMMMMMMMMMMPIIPLPTGTLS